MTNNKIIIAGGGLAGLIVSIHLTRAGVRCLVIEKKVYPFHRVCGEYISNEVVPYLRSLDAFPLSLGPSKIERFQLTSTNGNLTEMPLDLGGFGISRFRFDHFLYEHARAIGVEFLVNTEVKNIWFRDDQFLVETAHEKFITPIVIGTFGKRSKLDISLDRSFIRKRSPYVGVKYHVRLKDFPKDLIALHNFHNGYCGISRVEEDLVNLCYLTSRSNLKLHGNIPAMEQAVLFKNPFLKDIFQRADFVLEKPETINEISFETKAPVEQHILMAGDAAGMISPLCGNGMAIAIHSAKLLSEHVIRFLSDKTYSRSEMEHD
ncbi:MAG TPA: NAD(P)/FAD-dependent oxidoreductase, partial [Cyclobacteriaceae bacterium]|nr:NAD(P)/FAD-dependent oxidoreductase [Cyclobacteriaceae bacterium]